MMKTLLALTLLGACTARAAITAPEDPYFLCQAPYTQLTLYWSDLSNNETGFRIEATTTTRMWGLSVDIVIASRPSGSERADH